MRKATSRVDAFSRGSCISGSLLLLLLIALFSAQAQQPTITSFSPASLCQGGTVTITGTNFIGATNVKLGNLDAASFNVINATTIIASVADQAVSGFITVTTPDGAVASATALTIQPTPKPVLIDIGTLDGPFSNCNASTSYQLIVKNKSIVAGTGNVYQITWGDNSPAFMQTDWPVDAQTTHTYNAQGYFPVVITIISPNGCRKSVSYQFYKGRNPVAFFSTSTSTTALCTPASVEFQIGNWFNNSPGTTYVVDFGDGSPNVTLSHPLNATNTTHLLTHVYTQSSCPKQDYTATLKVTNGCYTTTYTLNQIIVRQKPVADFSVPAACVNISSCFTNQTRNGYMGNSCNTTSDFIWDFGDGSTSTGTDPCHTYGAAGTYTVTLTASNSACGSDVKTKQIVVKSVSPPPTVVSPVVYCQGTSAVPLIATGTNLLWYSPTGVVSSTAPTPSTTTAGTKTYFVTQTLPNSCESERVPITVTVNALPAKPGLTSPLNLCINQTATPLTATGTNLLWYTSSTGGTGSATAPTPSTTTTGSTIWYVSQTVNGCEGPRAAITVVVNPLPTAPIVTSPLTYCQNQAATRLRATGINLLWYTSATGGTGSPTAPIPSTSTPGNTTYYVSQTTLCGESPRAAIVVNVNANPSASISYNLTDLCNVTDALSTPNPSINVTLTGTPGGSYSISPATGLPIDITTGTLYPSGATAGKYTIKYTIPASGGCPDYSTTTTVTINNASVATIKYSNVSYCRGLNTLQQVSLSGTKGGVYSSSQGLSINTITGAINPSLSTPGTYFVDYTIAPSPPCPGYTATTSVEIIEAPKLTFSNPAQSICSGNTAVFIPSSASANNNYSWSVVGSLPATIIGVSAGASTDSIVLSFTNTSTISQTFTVRVTSITSSPGECASDPYDLTLTVNPIPAELPSNIFNFCMNTTPAVLTINPSSGNTVNWYDRELLLINDPPTINAGAPGESIYYVSQSNTYGCESAKTKIVALVQPAPSVPAITVKTPLCVGDQLILRAYSSIPGNTGLEYIWKGPGAEFPVEAPNVIIDHIAMEDAGKYTVTVSSRQTGCSVTADTLLQVGEYPIVQFKQDTIISSIGSRVNLEPVIINATEPGVLPIQTYTWMPSQELIYKDATRSAAVATVKNNVCYMVTVTNVYGCKGSDDVCVKALCQQSQVFVPNAFAPAGNIPENRKLIVRATGIPVVRSFRVYNRWGKIVFERTNFPPNSADYGWDGQVNGRKADTGVYIYTVDVICEDGVPYSFKGNVTLF